MYFYLSIVLLLFLGITLEAADEALPSVQDVLKTSLAKELFAVEDGRRDSVEKDALQVESPVRRKRQVPANVLEMSSGRGVFGSPLRGGEEIVGTASDAQQVGTPVKRQRQTSEISLKPSPGRGFFGSPLRGDMIVAAASAVNKSPARKVVGVLRGERKYDSRELSDLFSKIQRTPGRTCSRLVKEALKASSRKIFVTKPQTHEEYNYGVEQAFLSSSQDNKRNAYEIMDAAAGAVTDEESALLYATRLAHVVSPRIVRRAGGRVKAVSGGHNPKEYDPSDLCNHILLCQHDVFVTLIGTLDSKGAGGVKKTLQIGFDGQRVLELLRSSSIIAMQPAQRGHMYIHQLPDKSLIGTFAESPRSLMRATCFPLAIVDGSNRDEDGNVVVCHVGRYDHSIQEAIPERKIAISGSDYAIMLQEGTPVPYYQDSSPRLVNVTGRVHALVASLLPWKKITPVYAYASEVKEVPVKN